MANPLGGEDVVGSAACVDKEDRGNIVLPGGEVEQARGVPRDGFSESLAVERVEGIGGV